MCIRDRIDDDLYNDLEEQLILADVGPSCAVRLVDDLRDQVESQHLKTGEQALNAPVSYTHLDVYKRQAIWRAPPAACWPPAASMPGCAGAPLSLIHICKMMPYGG